jgi:chromosome segregation ATPase
MRLLKILGFIPWVTLVKNAPRIIDMSYRLREELNRARENRATVGEELGEVEERLDALERTVTSQAEMTSKLAEETAGLGRALETLTFRVTVLLWAVLAALGFAVYAALK